MSHWEIKEIWHLDKVVPIILSASGAVPKSPTAYLDDRLVGMEDDIFNRAK